MSRSYLLSDPRVWQEIRFRIVLLAKQWVKEGRFPGGHSHYSARNMLRG